MKKFVWLGLAVLAVVVVSFLPQWYGTETRVLVWELRAAAFCAGGVFGIGICRFGWGLKPLLVSSTAIAAIILVLFCVLAHPAGLMVIGAAFSVLLAGEFCYLAGAGVIFVLDMYVFYGRIGGYRDPPPPPLLPPDQQPR